MPKISETQKAYLAGVLDNFGAMNIRRLDTGTTQPMIFCSGNKPELMKMLGDLTASKVVRTGRPYSKHRCVEHCPDRHAEEKSTSLRWQVTGMKCTIFLYNVMPYMAVRAEEARTAFAAGIHSNFKGRVVDQMRDLGWDIPDLDAMKDIDFARGMEPRGVAS